MLIKSIIATAVTFISASLISQDMSKVVIKSQKVSDKIYMLSGQGGNIGALNTAEGVILIDDQFAPLTEKILSAVKEFSTGKIKFLINTHWHFDHTGGNENFGKKGSIVVAHKNVRKRMSTKQFIKAFNKEIPASPKKALPVITFEKEMAFHLGSEHVRVIHLKNAHTDGDSVIVFEGSNVIHAGDIFFNGSYPFIDSSSGGSARGMIKAVDRILKISNSSTKIIPGHGPLGSYESLKVYRKMLVDLTNKMSKLKKKGLSLKQIKEKKITKKYDAKWGNGFLNSDKFVTVLFGSTK